MGEFPTSACSEGNVSNVHSQKYGNSYTSMVGGKCKCKCKCLLYRKNSRSRPYYSRRCKRVAPASIESLPDEVLFDILVRLPAAHLHCKARFVCHRWFHIIHSYDFVNTQNHLSAYGLVLSSRGHEQLITRGIKISFDYLAVPSHPIFVTATQQGRIERHNDIRFKTERILLGSSNGLALETTWNDKSSLYIWNPAINHDLLLPRCSMSPEPRLCDVLRCGIGYAAASMEYKVTLPIYYNRFKFRSTVQYLAILTVGVDNSWRDVVIEHVPEGARRLLVERPSTTEGFIHWTNDNNTCILTLNVETEIITLRRIPFPHPSLQTMTFLSTGRYLSLFVSLGHGEDLSWEVWMMKSGNGEWSKLLPDIHLQQFANWGELKPLGWVKYPEVLAFYYHDDSRESNTIILFNLATHEINSIQLAMPVFNYIACVHKDTLICLT